MPLPSPQSQRARPIAFVLQNRSLTDAALKSVTLAIRPEELTRTSPSRMQSHYTAGGAFTDSFGPGIETISMSGTTGWRPTDGDAGLDGEDRFRALYDQVFNEWHKQRQDAVVAGRDPNDVRLVLADALDNFALLVAPTSFALRRSKSRPLLCQFQIQLTVLSTTTDPRPKAPAVVPDGQRTLSGLESLASSIDAITKQIKTVQAVIDATLVAPVREFMNQTAALYRAVDGAVRAVDGVTASLLSVATMSAQGGMNLFRSIGAVANLPTHVRAQLGQIASEYANVWCVLSNTLKLKGFYDDYVSFYGSSNCSSTSGGRPLSPLAGVNAFEVLAGAAAPEAAHMNAGARSSLAAMAQSDPVLAPLSTSAIALLLPPLNEGLVVS